MPLAHGLLGAGLVVALHPRPLTRRFGLPFFIDPVFIGMVLANSADFDFLLVFTLHSKAWHRGFTHSLVFALFIVALFLLLLGRRRLAEALAYGLAYASHVLLDYGTSRVSDGVELLWPFTRERMKLGWHGLSEEPSKLTAAEILAALALELALFAPLLLGALLWRRARAKRARAGFPTESSND